jgi:hypothetical protein
MKIKSMLLNTVPLAVLLFNLGAAHAQISVFTDNSSFSAAVVASSQLVDTFDDMTPGPLIVAIPLVRNEGRIVAGGRGTFAALDGGNGDVWLTTTSPGTGMAFYNLYLSTTYPNLGIGGNFFLTDENGAVAPGMIDVDILTRNGGRTVRLVNPTPDTFIGFLGLDVVEIGVTPVDSLYHVTANNFTLAAAVPEPETYAMLLAGLGMIGMVARRRAKPVSALIMQSLNWRATI